MKLKVKSSLLLLFVVLSSSKNFSSPELEKHFSSTQIDNLKNLKKVKLEFEQRKK